MMVADGENDERLPAPRRRVLEGEILNMTLPAVARIESRSDFAAAINEAWQSTWQSTVPGILETGNRLLRAKAALSHGEFGEMIARDLKFGDRTARRLMEIARNPVLSNRTHVSVLPPHWGTLYDLSRLPPATLEVALAEGKITPETERHNAFQIGRQGGTPITSRVGQFPCPACGGEVATIDWSDEPMDGHFKTQLHECAGECRKLWLTGTHVLGEYHKRSLPQKKRSTVQNENSYEKAV